MSKKVNNTPLLTSEELPPRLGRIFFRDKTLTQQQFGDESNINKIMERYQRDGVLDHLNTYDGQYGDFSNVASYQESLHQISEAENMFMQLPSQVRKEFENDPVQFVEFASNPANIDKLIELGLATPREAQTPTSKSTPAEGGKPSVKPSKDSEPKKPAPKSAENT